MRRASPALLLAWLFLTGFGCGVDQLVGSLATADAGSGRDGGDRGDGGDEDFVNSLGWPSDAGPMGCALGWAVGQDCSSACGTERCDLVCTGVGDCCVRCGAP